MFKNTERGCYIDESEKIGHEISQSMTGEHKMELSQDAYDVFVFWKPIGCSVDLERMARRYLSIISTSVLRKQEISRASRTDTESRSRLCD